MGIRRKAYETKKEKWRDFAIGLLGWLVINMGIWFVIGGGIRVLAVVITFPLNVVGLIALAVLRKWMAFGALAAVALNLVLTLIVQQTLFGACGIPFFVPAS